MAISYDAASFTYYPGSRKLLLTREQKYINIPYFLPIQIYFFVPNIQWAKRNIEEIKVTISSLLEITWGEPTKKKKQAATRKIGNATCLPTASYAPDTIPNQFKSGITDYILNWKPTAPPEIIENI